MKELATLGTFGRGNVDLEGSLAAVASKVGEIASNVVAGPLGGKFGELASCGEKVDGLLSQMEDAKGELEENDRLELGTEYSVVKLESNPIATSKGEKFDKKMTPGAPQLTTTSSSPATSAIVKVTPSPTSQVPSSQQQMPPTPFSSTEVSNTPKTPLPESPNPTRHAMGIEKSTPDSAIRPMVLTYRRKEEQRKLPSSETASPINSSTSSTSTNNKDMDGATLQSMFTRRQKQEATITSKLSPPLSPAAALAAVSAAHRSPPKSTSRIPTTPKAKATQRKVTSPRTAPPIIQNGTLAAASALMTLFGNEKS